MDEKVSKVLGEWTREDREGLDSTFQATVKHGGATYTLTIATNGHALVARVEGEGAGRVPPSFLWELLKVRPENAEELVLVGKRPTYWSAFGSSRDEQAASVIGLDAEYLARVGVLQRALGREVVAPLNEHIKEIRYSMRGVPLTKYERDNKAAHIDRLERVRDKYDRWAMTVWSIAGKLDPVLFAVQANVGLVEAKYGIHVAYVGAVMPWLV